MGVLNRLLSRKVLYILVCLIFFSTYVLMTSDSVEYYYYIDIFCGKMSVYDWNPERGILMPLILYVGKIIANSAQGILLVFGVFYLTLCWMVLSFIHYVNRNVSSLAVNVLVLLFLVANPILFSFSHTILTEFPAAVLSVFCFAVGFVFWKLRIRNIEKENIYLNIYLIISLIETFMFVILKANYIPIALVIIFGFEFAVLLEKKNKKNVVYSVMLLVLCMGVIVGYSKISANVSSHYKGDGGAVVIGGLRYFEIENADHKNGSTRIPAYLTDNRTITVMDDDENVIAKFEYEFEPSFSNHIGFVIKCFKDYPQRALAGYVDNYLLICDLYGRPWDDGKPIQYQTGYVIKGNVFNNLFDKIGRKQINQEYRTFNTWIREDLDIEWLVSVFKSNNWSFWNEYVESFRDINGGLIGRIICGEHWFNLFLFIYSIVVVISPVVLVWSFILMLKNRNKNVVLHFVVSAVVFSQAMMLSISGAVVDRYMFPAFLLSILLIIIDMLYLLQKIFERVRDGRAER